MSRLHRHSEKAREHRPDDSVLVAEWALIDVLAKIGRQHADYVALTAALPPSRSTHDALLA